MFVQYYFDNKYLLLFLLGTFLFVPKDEQCEKNILESFIFILQIHYQNHRNPILCSTENLPNTKITKHKEIKINK